MTHAMTHNREKFAKFLLLSILFMCPYHNFLDSEFEPISDAEFIPYARQFEIDTWHKAIHVPIHFVSHKYIIKKLGGTTYLGYCELWIDKAEIKISQERWWELSTTQKKLLIYHELGHCVLKRNHENGKRKNGCPKSIMRSFIFNIKEIRECYNPDPDYYINELTKENF